MKGTKDNLSRAASALLRAAQGEEFDLMLDGSGELGGRIHAYQQEQARERLAALGFTPASYNAALRARLAPDYPRMSYRTHDLLRTLEADEEGQA